MIYREYGKTGKQVSAISMGGMRFEDQQNVDDCVDLMLSAYNAGINYFDTAPGYGKSEEIFGVALQEMLKTRTEKPFYVATKSYQTEPSQVRRDLETSLARMGLDSIDFYHVWYVLSRNAYRDRKANGVLDEFVKLKEEGLIKHICVSTHAPGDHIEYILNDFPFDGVLLGYSVMNFAYREQGLTAAEKLGQGVMIMNPLGGGIIPQNAERFNFIKNHDNETVVQAALRFLLNDQRITAALVGLSNKQQLEEALSAVDSFQPIPDERIAQIKSELKDAFNMLCTNCRYCDRCYRSVPIPKLMEAYNLHLLGRPLAEMFSRLSLHWGVDLEKNYHQKCTKCGVCEQCCTQSLDITNRIQRIYELYEEFKHTRNTEK